MTHPIDAVLDDCYDILGVIETLSGRDLGPDDTDAVAAARDAAAAALGESCAATVVVVAELASGEALPDGVRADATAAALSRPSPDGGGDGGCPTCWAAAATLPRDDQLRVDGYYAALADAGVDIHSVVSQCRGWHRMLEAVVERRGVIEHHLDAVWRIGQRLNPPRRRLLRRG